jgi:hypothetical protein
MMCQVARHDAASVNPVAEADRLRRPRGKKRSARRWWTRERVRQGLLRFYDHTGLLPSSRHAYREVVSSLDLHKKGGRRAYPPPHIVLFHWRSFNEAWREIGVEDEARRAAAAQIEAWGLRLIRNRIGERHGKLEVVGLSGVKVCEYARRGVVRTVLWRCLCDCGRERVVESGVLGSATRQVTSCVECALARTTAAGLAALARLREETTTAR